MNEFKYRFINFILLALLGLGIYWAFTTIDNGITYDKDAVINNSQNTEQAEDIILFDNTKQDIDEIIDEQVPAEQTSPEVKNTNEDLINKLQKLADDKTNMDSGASGSKVGTIQEFLKIYFKDKNVKIDNDFGPTTKGLVRDFQKAELNGGDGRIGPNTLKAMIGYLE